MGDSQFPFRVNDATSRAAADREIRGILPMVRGQVETLNRLDLSEQALDEIFSNTIAHLWEHSLPHFDTARYAKVSTFLHHCSRRFIISEFRRVGREAKSRKRAAPMAPDDVITHAAPREELVDKIESLAADVVANPYTYLSLAQARVLEARLANPSMKLKDLADVLGYAHARTLVTMLRRIRTVLADLEIESHAPPATRKPH